MTPAHDVAIVGAGLLGLAAARAVAAQGLDFVVLEQAEVGHQGAGSKGSCRIFRLGYTDPLYVTAAMRARGLWDELESQTGRKVLLPTPQLTFGPELDAVRAAMLQAGAPFELLTRQALAEQFPDFRITGPPRLTTPAMLEPQSCVIAADAARMALAEAAGLDAAGRIRTGVTVTGVADDGRQVRLQTSDEPVTARTVIVTAGPWTAALLAPQLTLPTEPTLEQVGYLVPKAERQRPAPIFICHGSESAYGLPVPGSDRYKIGIHCSGPTVSPDQQDQEPDPVMLEQLVRAADWHVPGYQPNPVETERCIYDNTPDEDFILDRVGNIVIGCGTSGHGFKFGPLFGHWLAGLATVGPEALADSDAPGARERFGVARFRPDLAPETR